MIAPEAVFRAASITLSRGHSTASYLPVSSCCLAFQPTNEKCNAIQARKEACTAAKAQTAT